MNLLISENRSGLIKCCAIGIAGGSILIVSGWRLAAGQNGAATNPDETVAESRADNASDPQESELPHRLREGTRIENQRGYFRITSGTAEFVGENGLKLGGLPNLGLERIMAELKTTDSPEKMEWSVSGMATEFNGKNYLLVSRAVHKSRVALDSPGL